MRNTKMQIVLFFGILFCGVGLASTSPQPKPNLPQLKKGIELFESVLNQSLVQAFGGPFETLDHARGAYLPRYGVVFSFEVSLTPMQNLGPFAPAATRKSEEAEREEEAHRRDKAVSVAEDTLGNYSQALTDLTSDQSVAIVIHTVAAHPGKIERSTIVLSADKKLLDARIGRSIDQAQFLQKLSITEY